VHGPEHLSLQKQSCFKSSGRFEIVLIFAPFGSSFDKALSAPCISLGAIATAGSLDSLLIITDVFMLVVLFYNQNRITPKACAQTKCKSMFINYICMRGACIII
jgi:hypothetical protein